jgi:hypothetical protein
MAELSRIRAKISELAQRENNVTLSEIEWVADQLGQNGYEVKYRAARHGKLFRVGSQRFMVNYHNPGNTQVKAYSVRDFINAMIELGLYE